MGNSDFGTNQSRLPFSERYKASSKTDFCKAENFWLQKNGISLNGHPETMIAFPSAWKPKKQVELIKLEYKTLQDHSHTLTKNGAGQHWSLTSRCCAPCLLVLLTVSTAIYLETYSLQALQSRAKNVCLGNEYQMLFLWILQGVKSQNTKMPSLGQVRDA